MVSGESTGHRDHVLHLSSLCFASRTFLEQVVRQEGWPGSSFAKSNYIESGSRHLFAYEIMNM